MNENDALLKLTGQPVEVVLGGTTYQCRRANMQDYGKWVRYREKRIAEGDTTNLGLESSIYALSLVMSPYMDMSSEDLSMRIPAQSAREVLEAMTTVGFIDPQETPEKTPRPGEKSTRK